MITLSHPIAYIKKMILSDVGRCISRYGVSPLKALLDVSISLYNFSSGNDYTIVSKSTYEERVFRIFTKNTIDLNEEELSAIYRYYRRSSVLSDDECSDIEAKIIDSISDPYTRGYILGLQTWQNCN